MTEVAVQAETQTTALNPFEAVDVIAESLLAQEKPRDEGGKFTAKNPQADTEEEKPQAKPEESSEEKAEDSTAKVDEAETQAPTRKLKLKYKGEEKEVEEAEAVELAQKGYDYTQKSQALSKEREELSAKAKATEQAMFQKYEQQLEIQKQTVLRLVDQEALNADLNKLALEDPAKAQQLFFKKLQIQQTLQTIEAEQGKLIQQRQQEMQETLKKQAQSAVEKLQERIPGWNNDLYGKILKGATESYGFQSNEVNAITDHRAIEVLHDAMKWREYQAAKPTTVEKRVAAVPKVQKPGTTEKADPKANRIQESMARLTKTGARSDAEDAVMALLQNGRL